MPSEVRRWPRAPAAGPIRRACSFLLLWMIWFLVAVVAVVAVIAAWAAGFSMRFPPVIEVAVVIDIVLVCSFGWDPGKVLLGLRLVDDAGNPPSWGHGMLRSAVLAGPLILVNNLGAYTSLGESWVGWALLLAALIWPAIVGASVVVDRNAHGLHDRIADTRVLDVRATTLSDRVGLARPRAIVPPL